MLLLCAGFVLLMLRILLKIALFIPWVLIGFVHSLLKHK